MQHDQFGIYLNEKNNKVIRINSLYWVPKGAGWQLLTLETNCTLLRIREIVKEKKLSAEPEKIVWGDWQDVPRRKR